MFFLVLLFLLVLLILQYFQYTIPMFSKELKKSLAKVLKELQVQVSEAEIQL